MATVVDGRALAAKIREQIRTRAEGLPGGPPRLAAVLVGEDPASQIYVRMKGRAARKSGLDSVEIHLPESTTQDELLARVAELNRDPKIHGILVQLPLPDAIDPNAIAGAISPDKDVDCLNPANVGRLVAGIPVLAPCTPSGCIEILDSEGVQIEGAHAVVIGRSEIVGKPVSLLLLHRHATVTMCHSRTRDLGAVVAQADIVIAAAGRAGLVRGEWIRPGAAVIDVGTNRIDDKLVGDVEFDAAAERAGLITPVPGGVGPLTIAMVLRNTLRAFEGLTAAGHA